MTIWQRLRRLFGARHATGEPDVASLDASYREQAALLQQVRRGLADLTTSRRRVELQIAQLNQQAADLENQAAQAVAAGDDERARQVLGREVGLEQLIADLTAQRDALAADEAKLESTARSIETTIETFRTRKDTLKARYTAAQARAQIQDAFTGVAAETSGVGATMRAAERRTRELEAQADAVDELVSEGLMGDVLGDEASAFDRRLEQLSSEALTENKLAELKSAAEQTPAERADG